MSSEHDRHIDTVLQALRHAEPDAAMQDRLLAALHRAYAAHATGTTKRHWQWIPFARPVTGGLAMAAALLSITATLLHRSESSHPLDNRRGAPVQAGTLAHTSTHHPSHGVALVGAGSTSSSNTVQVATADVRLAVQDTLRYSDGYIRRGHISGSMEMAHMASSDDASVPAPPLQLTEQEQLLLRLVHREHPKQLTPLTASSVEEATLREKNSVNEFFATAPSVQQEQESSAVDQPAGQP